MLKGSFHGVSRELERNSKVISRKFQGCSKKVFIVLQRNFMGASRNFPRVFEGRLMGVLMEFFSGFQWCFKEVQMGG